MSRGENTLGLGVIFYYATEIDHKTNSSNICSIFCTIDVSVITKMDNLRKFWIVKKDNMLLIGIVSADQQGML